MFKGLRPAEDEVLLYLTADKSFIQAELLCGFKVYCFPSFLKG